MKIENKLKIAFIIIIVVAAFLMSVMFYTVIWVEISALEAEYGISMQNESLLNVAKVIIPSLQEDGTVSPVIEDLSYFKPFFRVIIIRMVVSAILILSGVGLLSEGWVKNAILKPVKELTDATDGIKEGNLDVEVGIPERSGQEIVTLVENFNDMRRILKESQTKIVADEEANREMISNISHDLKTPVTSIKGYAEGIMDGVADTPEKLDRYVRTIYSKANDLDRLINELTFYSEINENKIPYYFMNINISDYFDDWVSEIAVDMESKNIELKYDNRIGRSIRISADPVQLKKVVNNIVGNSVKYMNKDPGKLNIRLYEDKDYVMVDIADNGKGIEAKDLPYIFERFYRTDASRNSARGGSGIGLSIVKRIVEDHGGSISAESEPGLGTVMHIQFRITTDGKEDQA